MEIIKRLFKRKKFVTVKTKYKDIGDIIGLKDLIRSGDVARAIQGKSKFWYLELKKNVGKRLIKHGHAEEISKEDFLQIVESHH